MWSEYIPSIEFICDDYLSFAQASKLRYFNTLIEPNLRL